MAIIISKKGAKAVKVSKSTFGLESSLQEYIHTYPESIPIYEISKDLELLILKREYPTTSGPIDAVAIDRAGNIYIIETKLYSNPDKRKILAQLLDYGAALWKANIEIDAFLSGLDIGAKDNIQSHFELQQIELEELLSQLALNLHEGNYKFVVLMDSMSEQLKDLILFVNQNSRFDIYGVELEYYTHEGMEIVIPKLFGAEVKKDVSTGKRSDLFVSNEDFASAFSSKGLGKQIDAAIKLKQRLETGELVIPGWRARRTPKSINYSYKSPNSTKDSLVLSINYLPDSPAPVSLWLYDKKIESQVLSALEDIIKVPAHPIPQSNAYAQVAKWSLADLSAEQLEQFFRAIA